jgi:hypothetical protein
MPFVICSCCGNSIKDTKKENADYAERGQDKGFGTCMPCVEDMKAKPEPKSDKDEPQVIREVRALVDNSTYGGVTDCTGKTYPCDGFSASGILQVYEALSEENRAKFVSQPLPRMVDIAFKLINKQRSKA